MRQWLGAGRANHSCPWRAHSPNGRNGHIQVLTEKKGKSKKGDNTEREINLSFFQPMTHLEFEQKSQGP